MTEAGYLLRYTLKIIGISAGAAALLTLVLMSTCQDRALEQAQQRGDSIEVVARARDSVASAAAARDSATIDSLQRSKRPRFVTIRTDSIAQDSLERAMAGLTTAQDTIKNQARQIVVLKSERDSLRANARTDSLSLRVAMRRGDSLQVALHDQTAAVMALNAQLQRLNRHTFPKWLRVSFDVAQKALAVKGAVDIVQGR